MDVNGSKYHLLLGDADWAMCTPSSALHWDDARGDATLVPELYRFRAAPGDRALRLTDRRGAAADRFGNVYTIAPDAKSVQVAAHGHAPPRTFYPIAEQHVSRGPFRPVTEPPVEDVLLQGLAITTHDYLVVGAVFAQNVSRSLAQHYGLLIFDLRSSHAPYRLLPGGTGIDTFDIAATNDGGFVVLDRHNKKYWRFEPDYDVVGATRSVPQPPEVFQPVGTTPAGRSIELPTGFSLAAAVDLPGIDPIAIEALDDGRVVVLDRTNDATRSSRVFCYRDGVAVAVEYVDSNGATASDLGFVRTLFEPTSGAGFELVAHDLAGSGDSLYVVGEGGNQAFRLEIPKTENGALRLRPVSSYLPMRLCGGIGLIRSGTDVLYDSAGVWVPLVAQKRPRYRGRAEVQTPVFDSRIDECVWHRVMVDALVPEGASLRIESRSHDDQNILEALDYSPEPLPLPRSSGREESLIDGENAPYRTYELLFQRAVGRYVQLRLTLTGNGVVTPRLRALRAWYPRTSYVARFLPSVYRESDGETRFLERFLANFEGILTELEGRIARADKLLGAETAPGEALDWLGSLVALAMDPTFEEDKRRFLIRHAVELYAWRGTRRGVLQAIALTLCDQPGDWLFCDERLERIGVRILESFRTRPRRPRATAQTSTWLTTDATDGRWHPQQGGAALHAAWGARTGNAGAVFPLTAPSENASTWREFSEDALGVVPSATRADAPAFRAFLRRRYRYDAALQRAYGDPSASLQTIELPQSVPTDGAQLTDWFDFESTVLASRRTAHRFVVLLPLAPNEAAEEPVPAARRAAVRKAVELQAPAHTRFQIEFQYDAFRVGHSRVGFDTIVHERGPGIFRAPILGHVYLAATTLQPTYPADTSERFVFTPYVRLHSTRRTGDSR